jgi:hypothetical protein
MSKNGAETQAAAEILAKELRMLLSAVKEVDFEEQIRDELLAEQRDKIDSIYWEALDHKAVVTHPALQWVLSDHLKRMIDHFTYMRCGALHDHGAEALHQGDHRQEGRDPDRDEVVRGRRGTERLHSGSHVLLLRS